MTADALLQVLFKANLAGGAAVVLVLVFRRLVRARFGAAAAFGLWLLVPVAALGALIPARLAPAGSEVLAEAAFGGGEFGGAVLAAPPFNPSPAFVAFWLAGVAAFAALALYSSRRLASSPSVGPALVGVFRPRLVLPADFETRFGPAERRLILAHEAAHLAAGHPALNGLVEAARCLNWFNPLVHVAAYYARIDQELACDAAVIARHPAERRTYAEALLKSQLSPGFLPLGCQWPGRSEPLLAERIKMLARPRTSRARRLTATATIALASAAAGYAAWAAQPPRPATEAAVHAAIAAGDGLAVRARGGRPQEVIAALKVDTRLSEPGGAAHATRAPTYLGRFAASSGAAAPAGAARPAGPKTPDIAPDAAPTITAPDWMEKPTAADLAKFYPAEAAKNRWEGRVVITCRVGDDGRLSNCAVTKSEAIGDGAPAGHNFDFGTATLELAKSFRMAERDRNQALTTGGVVRIPVLWKLPTS